MRTGFAGLAVLACVLVGVSACDRDDDDRGGSGVAGICTPFAAPTPAATDPTAVQPVPGGGDAAAFDDCLHRWGYRLARAEDTSADAAGAATVTACAPVLARWNQATLAQPTAGPDTAVSLVTGESAGTLTDRYQSAQEKALFYVVQARAGNCAPPPATAAASAP